MFILDNGDVMILQHITSPTSSENVVIVKQEIQLLKYKLFPKANSNGKKKGISRNKRIKLKTRHHGLKERLNDILLLVPII